MKYPQLLLLASALLSPPAFAASFLNDFSSTPFTTETTDAQWNVAGGTYNNSAPGGTASSASFNLAGVRGTDFTMSTQFTLSSSTVSPTSGVSTIGFGVFGLDSSFTGANTGNAYYLADFGYAIGSGNLQIGRLRILSQGDPSTVSTSTGTALDNGAANFAI